MSGIGMRAGTDIPVPTHADIDVANGGAREERELFRARHQRREREGQSDNRLLASREGSKKLPR